MRTRANRSMLTVILLSCAALAAACGHGRTVLVTEESPMRTGPDVRGRLYLKTDGTWILSDRPLLVPEGWYLVPPRFVNEEEP